MEGGDHYVTHTAGRKVCFVEPLRVLVEDLARCIYLLYEFAFIPSMWNPEN